MKMAEIINNITTEYINNNTLNARTISRLVANLDKWYLHWVAIIYILVPSKKVNETWWHVCMGN